jgi:hypothetical protein
MNEGYTYVNRAKVKTESRLGTLTQILTPYLTHELLRGACVEDVHRTVWYLPRSKIEAHGRHRQKIQVYSNQISLSKKSFCISCFGCSSASETPWVAVAPYTPSAAKMAPLTRIAIIVSCLAQIPFPAAQYQLSLYIDVSNIYSTVTDLAKFLGKSTLRPSATASQ